MGLVPERGSSRSWEIRSGRAVLPAELDLPPHPEGFVVVAYPAATRRLDPRERFLAHVLHQAGLDRAAFDGETEHLLLGLFGTGADGRSPAGARR